MSTLFAFLVLGFVLALPVLFVILIVKAIRRKPVKKTALGMLGCFIGMIVSAIIFSAVDPQSNCEHEFVITENIDASCNAEGKIVKECPKCNKKTEEVLEVLSHEWIEADCENPKTCKLCGTTEGEKGGHKWKEATCTDPKTCEICNKTEGTVASHSWENATCTDPKTCSVCGLTEGEALSADKEHKWEEATCAKPKTCTICNKTEGTTKEHTLGEWEIVDEGTTTEQGTRQQKCTVCEAVVNTEKFDSPSKVVAEIVEKTAKNHSAMTGDIEVIVGDDANSVTVICSIMCKNSEQEVKNILSEIAEELKKTDVKAEGLFTIGDIEEGMDGECLAMASIDSEGNYNISSMSINFKTERNEWITSQFSAWDGSHTVLKSLIKDNMNDEKSFEHIETTYIDVANEEKMNQVNDILKQSGYAQRVDVGDLFVMTEFSGKNAFNATVKNTAFGIVDYSADTVTLIGIE